MTKYITWEKEAADFKSLKDQIIKSDWVSGDMEIVRGFPEYSERLGHYLNHGLSFLNRNELFLSGNIYFPYPNMTQIFDPESYSYVRFDKYLSDWVIKNISTGSKLLLVELTTSSYMKKLISLIRDKVEYRTASLYFNPEIYTPDFKVEKIINQDIVFQWQNMENPNFKNR